jgi:ABC-type glutathione transport system ATPase component
MGLTATSGARVVGGSVTLDGRELLHLRSKDLRRIRGSQIAMIFQTPVSAFNPLFKVGYIFTRALRLHGASRSEARTRARVALAEVRLPFDMLERYPFELSGGQAQRLAIALAVALRSQVLLADEPTSALDVSVQGEILDLIRRLRDHEDMAVLFVSHDLAVVAELCDQVAVMRKGRIVEFGAATQVLHSPTDDYTRQLVDSVPRLSALREG